MSNEQIRTFDDSHGRHALREPGGDNIQRDVLQIAYPERYNIHPMHFNERYVGAHRVSWWDASTPDEVTA